MHKGLPQFIKCIKLKRYYLNDARYEIAKLKIQATSLYSNLTQLNIHYTLITG